MRELKRIKQRKKDEVYCKCGKPFLIFLPRASRNISIVHPIFISIAFVLLKHGVSGPWLMGFPLSSGFMSPVLSLGCGKNLGNHSDEVLTLNTIRGILSSNAVQALILVSCNLVY